MIAASPSPARVGQNEPESASGQGTGGVSSTSWGEWTRWAMAAVESHITAFLTRLEHHHLHASYDTARKSSHYHGPDRRRNPRYCPLCHGPMRPDRRGPRDVRNPKGQVQRVPEEVLDWFSCTRCHRSQIGVPPQKLTNGWRPG